MRHLLTIVSVLMVITLAASCIERPDYVLDEPEMVDLLVDVHRAEGLFALQSDREQNHPDQNDQYQREVIATVLMEHGVTRQQYDSSLMWYAQHLNKFTRVYGHVEERLDAEQEQWSQMITEAQDFAVSAAGDSVELWTMANHLVLDPQRHTSIRSWEVPSDSNFVAGDTLRWQFAVRHMLPTQRLIVSASLTRPEAKPAERWGLRPKKEDTGPNVPLGYVQQVLTAEGRYQFTLRCDSLQPFGTARLHLAVINDSVMRVSPVFIDSISLTRLHRATP